MKVIPIVPTWWLVCATLLVVACAGSNGEITTVNDPFGGPQRGFVLYLDSGHYSAISVNEAKGKYAMDVLVVLRGLSDLVGRAGDKGQFIVGGKIMALESVNVSKPVANANGGQVFTQWMIRYDLTKAQVERLADAPLTALKCNIGEQFFQIPLTPAQSTKIQENLDIMSR